MTMPALPPERSTNWYGHYTALDSAAREVTGGRLSEAELRAALGTRAVRVKKHGAKGDALSVLDAAMTSGSAVLTSATGLFTAAHVGKTIYVEDADGGNQALWTTIASRQSATQVTLAAAATATVSGRRALWGTDDTDAIVAAYEEAGEGGAVDFGDGGFITDTTFVPDGCTTLGAGAEATILYRKPSTMGTDPWGVLVPYGSSAARLRHVKVFNLTVDGSGPRETTGWTPATSGGKPGLHRGTRTSADENSAEGINLKSCDWFHISGVTARFCIGDGFDADDSSDGLFENCVADSTRVGFHTSNGSRRVRRINCTAAYCQQGFDQSTQSGYDSVDNFFDGLLAYNSLAQNFNIMATTEASAPGNPNGLNPAPVGPFYGTTAAKFSVSAGSITVDSTVGNFQGSDVGKPITLYGAGAAGANLKTTIAAVLSTTRLQVATNASTAVAETENKPLVYGYGVGTAVVNNIRSITQAVDTQDGRTGRSPATHDLFVGVRPPGLYKDDFGNSQGGGLGWASAASTEYASMASHNYSGSDPARVLHRIFFGNNPNFRRVEFGAEKEAGNAVGYVLYTSPSGNELRKRIQVDGQGNVVLNAGGAALAATATNGFTYIPVIAGPPTGVPTSKPGTVAFAYEEAASKLWIGAGGAWKSVTFA